MTRTFSRRELLRFSGAAAAAAAVSRRRAAAQDAPALQPEVAVITALGPDHPLLKSLISQLLENGVYFDVGPDQALFGSMPPREGYKALVFDEPALEAALRDPDQRRRLDEYAKKGGFVFEIAEPIEGRTRPGVNANWLVDLVTSQRAYDMITHASLTRFHPEMKRLLLARPVDRMLSELQAEMMPRLETMESWGEYTLHYWKAAQALLETGRHPEMRDALIASIRRAAGHMTTASWADDVAGYFATAWLFDQTGDKEPLSKARAFLDRIIADRPRTMGVLTYGGFVSDPLGLSQGWTTQERTTVRRDVVWTEIMHFHGPAFASMTRVTRDRKYLDEAIKLADHIARYHLRPDNLLAHCTRDGKPVAGAWARGQTHALYGLLYMLEEMQPDEPAFARVLDCIRRVGQGLRRCQDNETGLWRNVIDNPSARLESSSSIGITYVYARCIREGWLERGEFEPMLRRSWEGLRRFYWRQGMAANCRGTATGVDEVYYLARQQGWGRMPHMILATVEMQRLFG